MTTASTTATRRVHYQLETLRDYGYVPTHHELESLYETARRRRSARTSTYAPVAFSLGRGRGSRSPGGEASLQHPKSEALARNLDRRRAAGSRSRRNSLEEH